MSCLCALAGYCPTFGKTQSSRHWQICRGEVLTPEACDAYRANWMGLALSNGHDPMACSHRGEAFEERTQKVESKTCGTCAKRGEVIPVYRCDLHGRCTLRPWQPGQIEAVCQLCSDRKSLEPRVLDRRRIAPNQLLPSEFQFNNSLIRFGSKLLMAYRVGWDNARIAVAELDESYNVVRNSWLPLNLGMAQEDPRLWVFRGELHVSFTAVYQRHRFWTDVCYARLAQQPDGFWTIADEYFPRYPGRADWEKNWGFFEHDGDLLAVYSISPHKILRIDRERAELVAETRYNFRKSGLLHGGAPPVFHRGEYYSFYHRRLGQSHDKWYTLDLYTFEAQPPFRPSRQVESPLLAPQVKDRPGRTVPHAIFPGGAFIDDLHRWTISFGYYDKWSEVSWWGINEVESCLVAVPGGYLENVAARKGTNDLAMWKEVHDWNEYELPDQFETSDVIVDIGAHIGSFARACLDRGAGYVIACEPYPPSFMLLKQNLAYYVHRAEALQIAVGGEPGSVTLRNPDRTGNTVGISGVWQRGDVVGQAALAPLSDVLPGGDVRLLKLDCEGAEYSIVENGDLSRVAEIVGEAHVVERDDQRLDVKHLTRLLEQRGFYVESRPTSPVTWLFWAWRAV